MLLYNTSNFYFAFNWNPPIKNKKTLQYYRIDDFLVIDIWKFRILITGLKEKVKHEV